MSWISTEVFAVSGPVLGVNCSLVLGSVDPLYPKSAGVDSFSVQVAAQTCEWDVQNNIGFWAQESWISIISPTSTQIGDGEVHFEIEENTGESRQGRIYVATLSAIASVVINQEGAVIVPPEPSWPPEAPGNVADGGVILCFKSDEWMSKLTEIKNNWERVTRIHRDVWRKP